jgi:hypothetical protein
MTPFREEAQKAVREASNCLINAAERMRKLAELVVEASTQPVEQSAPDAVDSNALWVRQHYAGGKWETCMRPGGKDVVESSGEPGFVPGLCAVSYPVRWRKYLPAVD